MLDPTYLPYFFFKMKQETHIFSLLALLLIQVRQLSLTGEKYGYLILVHRSKASPGTVRID